MILAILLPLGALRPPDAYYGLPDRDAAGPAMLADRLGGAPELRRLPGCAVILADGRPAVVRCGGGWGDVGDIGDVAVRLADERERPPARRECGP